MDILRSANGNNAKATDECLNPFGARRIRRALNWPGMKTACDLSLGHKHEHFDTRRRQRLGLRRRGRVGAAADRLDVACGPPPEAGAVDAMLTAQVIGNGLAL